jgi:8-oxo-dGTP diphosphatase
VLGRTLDRRNFQKKMLDLGILDRIGERRGEGVRRAPYLYRFNLPRYAEALREGISLGK